MAAHSLTDGFSEVAKAVAEATGKARRRLAQTNALGNESLFEELGTVWDECRQPGWDGYDAFPVTQDTLRNTYILLESLPLGCPSPSIAAEPDGDLTVEWHRSPYHTLSVSVTPIGELHYAALLGPNQSYGTEVFFGEIPERILSLIRQVCME
jgi:hypothetical protein